MKIVNIYCCIQCPYFIEETVFNPAWCKQLKRELKDDEPDSIPTDCPLDDFADIQNRLLPKILPKEAEE